MQALLALLLVLLGALLGAVGTSRWWFRKMRDPAVSRRMLEGLYQTAHPHFLQVSRDDATRVCPCCGWTERTSPIVNEDVRRAAPYTP